MSKDYYHILGVKKDASPDEIKKVFRRLAHEHHPDKGGDQQKFKDVNEAYQVLGDTQKRKTYDQFGSAAFEQAGNGAPGGFGDFGGFSVNMEDLGDLGDMFGQMFGFGSKGRGGQKQGHDVQTEVTIDFLESVTGVKKSLSLYLHDRCETCDGSGAKPGATQETCKTCHGQGAVQQATRTVFGVVQTRVACSECSGLGKRPSELCGACKGSGVTRKTKQFDVEIPAGIESDQGIKISGAGEYPGGGGRAGDLYIRVMVRPHPMFTRQGNDVLSTSFVPYSVLSLGANVEIETVDGPGTLTIPESTESGTVFRIRHKGFPYARSGSRGDQLVTVVPSVTRKLSKDQRRALEGLREVGL